MDSGNIDSVNIDTVKSYASMSTMPNISYLGHELYSEEIPLAVIAENAGRLSEKHVEYNNDEIPKINQIEPKVIYTHNPAYINKFFESNKNKNIKSQTMIDMPVINFSCPIKSPLLSNENLQPAVGKSISSTIGIKALKTRSVGPTIKKFASYETNQRSLQPPIITPKSALRQRRVESVNSDLPNDIQGTELLKINPKSTHTKPYSDGSTSKLDKDEILPKRYTIDVSLNYSGIILDLPFLDNFHDKSPDLSPRLNIIESKSEGASPHISKYIDDRNSINNLADKDSSKFNHTKPKPRQLARPRILDLPSKTLSYKPDLTKKSFVHFKLNSNTAAIKELRNSLSSLMNCLDLIEESFNIN